MFNFIFLLTVLIVHIVPFKFGAYLNLESEYNLYIITLLGIISLQSLYIYKELSFKTPYTKVVAILLLIASLWFFCDYVYPLTVDKSVELEVLMGK